MPHWMLYISSVAILVAAILLNPLDFAAATTDSASSVVDSNSSISGDPNQPRRHFRVRDGAKLDDDGARAMYARIESAMANGYALADGNVAKSYQQWGRFNTTPYTSATHGRRYINNFGNDLAAEYGKFEDAPVLPEGAILAKDSFTVTREGTPVPGPLFIMEKMAPGFNYVSGDWRYSMIMPDGSLFGATKGTGAERVEFCIGCHLAREKSDHLFYVPRQYRRSPP